MSEIEDIADTEFDEVLQQVQLDECDVVNSCKDEQLDMLEELLAVVSAPADNTLHTLGMAPRDERCPERHLWMDLRHRPTPLSHLHVWL